MKHFGKQILILIGIVIIAMVLLDATYTYLYRHAPPRSKVQKVMQLRGGNYDFVFFGSSRTENHIDCEIVEKLTGKSCINLGIGGSTLADAYLMMQLMKENDVKIKYAFVQIDYGYNHTSVSASFKSSILPYISRNLIQENVGTFGDKIPFYRYLKNDKIIGFREVFNLLIKNPYRYNLDNGFIPKEGVGHNTAGSFPKDLVANNASIDGMKNFFKENNIEPIYFLAPYCKNVKNRDFADKLKTRIPELFNYVSLFDSSQEYFSNCGHLNTTGARKFTELLIKETIQ